MTTVYTHTYRKELKTGYIDVQKFIVCIYPMYTRYYFNGYEITRQEYCSRTNYYSMHGYDYSYVKKEV